MKGKHLDRIVVDPDVLVGKPVVRDARIPVEQVLEDLSEVLDVNLLLEAFPRLTVQDVQACLVYTRAVVERKDVFPVSGDSRAY